jgi:hypothetical protein
MRNAIKGFYKTMIRLKKYSHANPLIDLEFKDSMAELQGERGAVFSRFSGIQQALFNAIRSASRSNRTISRPVFFFINLIKSGLDSSKSWSE